MFSIRKQICASAGALVMIAGALAFTGGCQVEQRFPATEPTERTPMMVDPAMAQRNWDPTPALYASDTVLAWPDYAPLRAKPLPVWYASFSEPTLFLGNTFYIPYGVFKDSPFKQVEYKSMSMPASYSDMPPLKAESAEQISEENNR